ncbi:MAG TPA: RNA polymerase sigma factor [Bryobacteraceae bacterium]|nr:RNA polymerase sigma factor [Bryobacteraceae bacterium]
MTRETAINDVRGEDAAAEFAMDEQTFRGFYERNARGLWAYLARTTGDRALADDLLQETFYRFLRAGAAYESDQHRRNSLYRIATNLAADERRRRAVRAPAGEIEGVAANSGAAAERTADLSRALAQLKPRERAMLWMAYAEGATHREIARILGVEAASLKPLLFRARRKLAALLGGKDLGGKS